MSFSDLSMLILEDAVIMQPGGLMLFLSPLYGQVQILVYRALSNALILPWPSCSENDQVKCFMFLFHSANIFAYLFKHSDTEIYSGHHLFLKKAHMVLKLKCPSCIVAMIFFFSFIRLICVNVRVFQHMASLGFIAPL